AGQAAGRWRIPRQPLMRRLRAQRYRIWSRLIGGERMNPTRSLAELEQQDAFIRRHIGPDAEEQRSMLQTLGLSSLDELIDQTVPRSIRLNNPLELAGPRSETDVLACLREMAAGNQLFTSCIGMGYYDTILHAVILRPALYSPGRDPACAPRLPWRAQRTREALPELRRPTRDLTGMPPANASLLDEATAAAEAMTLARRVARSPSNAFFSAQDCHPQTISVVRTRA